MPSFWTSEKAFKELQKIFVLKILNLKFTIFIFDKFSTKEAIAFFRDLIRHLQYILQKFNGFFMIALDIASIDIYLLSWPIFQMFQDQMVQPYVNQNIINFDRI